MCIVHKTGGEKETMSALERNINATWGKPFEVVYTDCFKTTATVLCSWSWCPFVAQDLTNSFNLSSKKPIKFLLGDA